MSEQVWAFLSAMWTEKPEDDHRVRTRFTSEQYWASYPSWAHGGNAWGRYGLGGTATMHAIMWYQHVHRPGSKEWRPSIIMRAVKAAAAGDTPPPALVGEGEGR